MRGLRRRFWVEAALAPLTAALASLTLVSREWVEFVFRIDPDGGSGMLEWAIVGSFLVMTVACTLLANSDFRKARALAAG